MAGPVRTARDRARGAMLPLIDRYAHHTPTVRALLERMAAQSAALLDPSWAPEGPGDARWLDALALLLPVQVPGLTQVRVGGPHDGGYVMLDRLDAVGAVSVGVGPDVSWDADIAGRGIPVAAFDHTVAGLPWPVAGVVFHRIGVDDGSGAPDLRPLADLIALGGFPDDGGLLLSIDVEGAEYHALAAAEPAALERFTQIVVELHDLDRLSDDARGEQIVAGLRALTRDHVVVHLHANNGLPPERLERLWVPPVLEVSLVRHDLAAGAVPAPTTRSPLDAPCQRHLPELDVEALLRARRR